MVGRDGKTTIFGVAAEDVVAVTLELSDVRLTDAPLYEAPPDLKANVRFFIVRLLLPSTAREPDGATLRGTNPVRAYIARDGNGNVLERVEG